MCPPGTARTTRAALACVGAAAALTACRASTGGGAGTDVAVPAPTVSPADRTPLLPTPTATLAPADDDVPTVVDNGLPHSSPTPFPIGLATAGPDEFTVDNQFPGVAIHLVTSGGIFPWDVRLLVARDLTVGPLWDRMPGGAWRIRLPTDAAPLRPGSTLTLPYATGRLDGFPEQDLRIYCYDPGARAWQLTADDQTVDVDADTVTTPVSRLSDCAVFSIPPDA